MNSRGEILLPEAALGRALSTARVKLEPKVNRIKADSYKRNNGRDDL
jgi:hypothetical protein